MTDSKEIGRFIAECRKEKNLTQKVLGEKLNVSDRAVSKWENGRSFPDVAIVEQLCGELGISLSELLAGKRIEEENYQKETEKMLIASISNAQLYGYQIALQILNLASIFLVGVPVMLFMNIRIELSAWLSLVACILMVACSTYLDIKIPGKAFRRSNRWIEGIGAGITFISISMVNFAVGGKRGGLNGKEQKIFLVWFLFCLAVVVAASMIIASVRRKEYERHKDNE